MALHGLAAGEGKDDGWHNHTEPRHIRRVIVSLPRSSHRVPEIHNACVPVGVNSWQGCISRSRPRSTAALKQLSSAYPAPTHRTSVKALENLHQQHPPGIVRHWRGAAGKVHTHKPFKARSTFTRKVRNVSLWRGSLWALPPRLDWSFIRIFTQTNQMPSSRTGVVPELKWKSLAMVN